MNRKGQALVEFVLILPLFILMLFAIVDFGMIMNKKNELENVSMDVVSMIKNDNSIDEIRNMYPELSINLKEDDKYIIISIERDLDIITPGLNLILGDPYTVKVERTINNV